MKIIIGVDGSPYSDAAVEEVAQRTWPNGTEIRVLHASQLPLAPTPEVWVLQQDYYEQLESAIRTKSKEIVQAAVAILSSRLNGTTRISGRVIMGSAKRVLLDEAERWGADLIVVGSHGYPTWERLLLGSVSQAVVSHAKCSVEVVRLPHAAKVAA